MTDMWALGKILFAMFFGQIPFQSARTTENLFSYMTQGTDPMFQHFIDRHPLTANRVISDPLKRLLMKLLTENTEKRPTVDRCL
jgi:serine/threonine protein kinase